MKIILIGYGRMGHLIEQTALAAGDQVVAALDIDNISDLASMGKVADVVIDFSNPASLPDVAAYIRRTGTALLSGTTGCTQKEMAVFETLGQYAPVIHSANYSVGVAVLRRALEQVSDVLKPNFDIEIVETHHNQKVDAPSGTAKLLLNAVDPSGEYTPIYGRQGNCGKRGAKEIGVHALRGGTEAGTHTVSFFGADEVLEFTHRATSRQIFVNGALHTAHKLITMPNGRYQLQDILFGGQN